MLIRQAQSADAAAIAAAEHEFSATPGVLVARPGEIPPSAFADKINKLTERGRYVVAEVDGAVVGHAFLDPLPLTATQHVFSLNIVVHPGHQRRGIGRALLADLLRWAAADERVHKVELLVRATNERAIRLYRGLGFLEEGRLHDRVRLPDGSFVDDLMMAWFPPR